MNSSWYNIYKKANALPFDQESNTPPYLRNTGVIKIDEKMTEETAQKEKKKVVKYLDSGCFGVVTDIGNNQVRKYTSDKKEAEKAESLIGNTKYPVVKIFSVEQLQDELWAIDMERCTPLRKVCGNENIDIIDAILKQLRYNDDQRYLSDTINSILNNQKEYVGREIQIENKALFSKHLKRMIAPLVKLKEIGLSWDCKIQNIVVTNNGNWVMCDLAPEPVVAFASNWYNLHKYSGPLPFDTNNLPPNSRNLQGLDNINEEMTQDTADKEKKIPNLKYLDNGNTGLVVDIGNNRVRKYTRNKKEAYNAKLLIGQNEYPVATIYKLEQLQDNLWAFEMEKLPILESVINKMPEKEMLYEIFVVFNRSKNFNEFKKNLAISKLDNDISQKYMHQFERLYTLSEIDLLFDCYVNNLGVNKDGEWVLFDIGGLT